MVKTGGNTAVEQAWKVCMEASKSGWVPNDWTKAAIVPLYKGMRSKSESKNY